MNGIMRKMALVPWLRQPGKPFGGFLRHLVEPKRSAASYPQLSLNSQEGAKDPAHAKPPSQIPGPRRWPFIGSLLGVIRHKEYSKEKLHMVWESLFREYGPIYRLDTPGQQPTIFIHRPEDVEYLFKNTPIGEKPMFKIIADLRNSDTSGDFVKGESGLMFEGGEEWARLRSLIQPPTMKMKIVGYYLHKHDSVTLEFIDKMYGMRDNNNELPEDFIKHVFHWAMESLCLVTFGKSVGCLDGHQRENEILKDGKAFLLSIREAVFDYGGPLSWFSDPVYKRFVVAHNKILSYVKVAVENAKSSLEGKKKSEQDLDLLEVLLLTPGLKMSDIYGYLVDILAAGVENVSATAAFTMLNLARHPDKQEKLREELDRVLGKDTAILSPQQMSQLSYLKCTIKETLRMHSVSIGLPRRLENELVIGGYRIPKGFDIMVMTKYSGMMEESFPNADQFIPERWLRDRPLGPINPYASLPFGTGPRMCVGRRFAEQEIYTLIARLFHKYQLDWKYGEVGTKMELLLTPDSPLKFTMTKRE